MVAKPAATFRYASAPQSVGALAEATFNLFRASWRAGFWYALAYGLAGMLPALSLGDFATRVMRESAAIALGQAAPWLPRAATSSPAALSQEFLAWLGAPMTWLLFGTAMLSGGAALTLLVHRQDAIARGESSGFAAATRAGFARVPAALAAWFVYALLMLLLTLPMIGFAWLLLVLSLSAADPALLMLWLIVFVIGSLLLSTPLAWGSVAYGFAPFASSIAPTGPIDAHRESARCVRGHWVHAAVAVTLPLLIYLAVASTISSAVLTLCVGVAYATGGLPAVFAGDWWMASQWIALAPTAAALPLATGGMLIAWRDLQLRSA